MIEKIEKTEERIFIAKIKGKGSIAFEYTNGEFYVPIIMVSELEEKLIGISEEEREEINCSRKTNKK